MRVEHCPRQGEKGGGLATLVPMCITILETWHALYVLYTQVAAEAGVMLHVLNTYHLRAVTHIMSSGIR